MGSKVDNPPAIHDRRASITAKTWLRKFFAGNQIASATVYVPLTGDEAHERVKAETQARKAAMSTYRSNFGEIEWDTATWLISHTTDSVTAFLEVETRES
jgi:hypothetical protein